MCNTSSHHGHELRYHHDQIHFVRVQPGVRGEYTLAQSDYIVAVRADPPPAWMHLDDKLVWNLCRCFICRVVCVEQLAI